MSETKVEIKHMSKIYPNGDGITDIEMAIRSGEILTLLGPSGCGKSTLLRCLGGFQSIDDGQVMIDGVDISHLPADKRPTSMVFQGYNLWEHMTVYENFAFGLKLRKLKKAEIRQRISDMLALLKLPGVEKKYPSQLSGGQQQRIAIGRSLLLQPAVLLLDEPFSALDAKIRQQMREELKRIQAQTKVTIVFVTHDQEEAMSLSDRIVVMEKGKIAQIGTPSEIYETPNNRYTASFIGEMNFLPAEEGKVTAFRPEDSILSVDSGDHEAKVAHIMNAGHYSIIYATYQDQRLKFFSNKDQARQFQQDQPLFFTITNYHVY